VGVETIAEVGTEAWAEVGSTAGLVGTQDMKRNGIVLIVHRQKTLNPILFIRTSFPSIQRLQQNDHIPILRLAGSADYEIDSYESEE
jgi:hypothetical protein